MFMRHGNDSRIFTIYKCGLKKKIRIKFCERAVPRK